MTHRSLLALVLAPDVWDLPFVVHRCYPLSVAPLRGPVSKSYSDVHCCNPWVVATVDKITALITAALLPPLALTRLLQTLSY